MNKLRAPFLILAGLVVALQGLSQVQSVNQSTAWLLLNQNIRLSSTWAIVTDQQFAFSQNNQGMQHMLRGGVNYNLPKGFSVVPIGHGYVWNYLYGKQPAALVNNEQMVWEQINFNHRVSRIGVSHRLRMEERFIQNNQLDANGNTIDNGYSNYQNRLRYRFMMNVPINRPSISSRTVFLNAWGEFFYSWGKTVQYHSINQNRGFTGLGYQANNRLTLVGGPYVQQLIKGTGNRVENNIGYQMQLTYLFDLSKKS